MLRSDKSGVVDEIFELSLFFKAFRTDKIALRAHEMRILQRSVEHPLPKEMQRTQT